MELLQIVKLAKGLPGLLMASWGVYALKYIPNLEPPFHELALSACLVAMFIGVLGAGVQLIRMILK